MSTTNVALLRTTLDHIETNPEDWCQHKWHTCFAGHAAILSGARWLTSDDDEIWILDESGTERYVHTYAAGILGLDADHKLFDADNTLDDLRRIVAELCSLADVETASN